MLLVFRVVPSATRKCKICVSADTATLVRFFGARPRKAATKATTATKTGLNPRLPLSLSSGLLFILLVLGTVGQDIRMGHLDRTYSLTFREGPRRGTPHRRGRPPPNISTSGRTCSPARCTHTHTHSISSSSDGDGTDSGASDEKRTTKGDATKRQEQRYLLPYVRADHVSCCTLTKCQAFESEPLKGQRGGHGTSCEPMYPNAI